MLQFNKIILLISFLTSFTSHAQHGWYNIFDRIQGKPSYVESASPTDARQILERFLYPEQSEIMAFPVSALVWKHLTRTITLTPKRENLAAILENYAGNLHLPFKFKQDAEYCATNRSYRMGPKTSFYFYIAMLTLMRDMPSNGELIIKEPFTAKAPFSLNKTLRKWSYNAKKRHRSQQGPTPVEQTIYSEILEHRAAYYELVAYRFFDKNKRLDGWGKYYRHDDKSDLYELGMYDDTWEKVSAELNNYYKTLGSYNFAKNIAKLTGTSASEITSYEPHTPTYRIPMQLPDDSSTINTSESSSDSDGEQDRLLKKNN